MKRRHTAKRFVAKLPEDFQEVLMTTEMELQQGLTVPILRKLVYLYTRGMQYYDLVHKDQFRQFYSDKLVSLLTRKDVEQFLDKNPINFDDKKDLDQLYSAPQKEQNASSQSPQKPPLVSKNTDNLKKEEDKSNTTNPYYKLYSNVIRRNSAALLKNKFNVVDIGLLVKEKILEVSTNLNKIDKAMTNEVIEQMTEFEENKRQREVRQSPYIINNKNDNNKENKNKENELKNEIIEEEKDNNNVIKSEEDELKILEIIGINDKKENEEKKEEKEEPNNVNNINNVNNVSANTKNTIGKNPMLREIEVYVQKNMDEMYQALEELKASFQSEIKDAEENGFDDIAEGLKEDLQNELDNLKEQYEEQRRVETEKIKLKYSKRNSLIIS